MPPYVYGSGYDQVAAQKNFYDSFYRQLLENNAARKAQAEAQAQQFSFHAQQADDAAAQANNAVALHLNDQAQRGEDQQRNDALHRFEFGVQQAADARNFDAGQQARGENLAFEKKKFDTQFGDRKSDQDFGNAVNFDTDSPEKLNALFPNMTPQQKAVAQEAYRMRNQRQNEEYNSIAASGARLNAEVVKARQAKALTGLGPDPKKDGWFNTDKTKWDAARTQRLASLPELTDDEARLILTGQNHPGSVLSKVVWDPASQQYVPTMTRPYQFTAPSSQVVGGSAMVGAPGPRFTFPSGISSDAPAVMPASVSAFHIPVPQPIGSNGSSVIDFSNRPPVAPAPAPSVAVIPPTGDDLVPIKSPSGKVGKIPRKNLAAALARGAVLIE